MHLHALLPLMALFGPDRPGWRRLFLRVKRTAELRTQTSEFDPFQKSATFKDISIDRPCASNRVPTVTLPPPVLEGRPYGDWIIDGFQLLSESVEGAALLPDLVSRASVTSCRIHCILGRAG